MNQAYLVAMMEMGIPKHKAEIALTETGNVGVEVATEWLFSTPDTTQFEHYTSDTGIGVCGCGLCGLCPAGEQSGQGVKELLVQHGPAGSCCLVIAAASLHGSCNMLCHAVPC